MLWQPKVPLISGPRLFICYQDIDKSIYWLNIDAKVSEAGILLKPRFDIDPRLASSNFE